MHSPIDRLKLNRNDITMRLYQKLDRRYLIKFFFFCLLCRPHCCSSFSLSLSLSWHFTLSTNCSPLYEYEISSTAIHEYLQYLRNTRVAWDNHQIFNHEFEQQFIRKERVCSLWRLYLSVCTLFDCSSPFLSDARRIQLDNSTKYQGHQ